MSNAPSLSIAVDPTTNRIQTNASYDGNGNLTGYAGDGYGYDGRNRMVQANPMSGGTVLYGYDTTNHRIYKGAYNNGTYSAEEIYFYGVEGHLYGTWQVNPSSGVLLQASVTKQWFGGRLVSPEDRLGSKGKYFAFGEERTNVAPANPPNDQEKFATYTRDSATGLDYANQRYYSSPLGRFTRPDPFGGSANPRKPQSWNRYAYVENDPANAHDPNGLELADFAAESDLYGFIGDSGGGGGFVSAGQPADGQNLGYQNVTGYYDPSGNFVINDPAVNPQTVVNVLSNDVPLDSDAQQIVTQVGQQMNSISVGGFAYADLTHNPIAPGVMVSYDSNSGFDAAGLASTHVNIPEGISAPNSVDTFPGAGYELPLFGNPTPIYFIPITGFAGIIYEPGGTIGVYGGNSTFGAGYYLNLGGGAPGASTQ